MYTTEKTNLVISRWLSIETILYFLPSFGIKKCKNKKAQINKHKLALNTVTADLYHNLDIVNLMARLRMHGFALALLLDQQSFNLISSKAKTKPLKHPSDLKFKPLWRQLELFSFSELMLISFCRLYFLSCPVLELKNAKIIRLELINTSKL